MMVIQMLVKFEGEMRLTLAASEDFLFDLVLC